jgi:GGDEF domain-containing protein
VYGTAAPFDRQPLVSATAHLGLALWKLDYRPTLLPGIVAFVRANRRDDGGFGDPGQPSDVLTTLAAAELLSTLDPHWDPRPTAEWFAATQEPAGWWRAFDPEVPWLTAEILDWLRRSTATFEARFGWPVYQKLDRDRKTGIPGYAAFDRLIRALSELDGFRSGLVELAFIDLAHFKKFNEDLGQDRGDDVLRFFAQSIAAIPASLAIRDGGDEFILVGAPTAATLADGIAAFRAEWPRRFAAEFGPEAPAVAPRIIVAPATGGTIREAREELGRLITRVKEAFKEPGPEGVLLDVAEARAIARETRV